MAKLEVSPVWPGCARGKYSVRARGCILAVLRWGMENAPLADWGPFAYVPVDPAGNGEFFFDGCRGIPREATHVWAACWAGDFSSREDISAAIPAQFLQTEDMPEDTRRFSVLTDLHLSSRPWTVRQALRSAQSEMIFLLGDSTNDGLKEQFEAFRACIDEIIPEKIFFPVTGNHDVLHASRGTEQDGCGNYAAFQKWLLGKAEARGHDISFDPEGRAYALKIGALDVIGLQCVTDKRRFLFPEGRQIDWLEDRLGSTAAAWHIILCHAPFLKHNPNRNEGIPYLDKNRRLQEIVDRTGGVIFLSGHTHVSPNGIKGNGEFDKPRRNIYLDCGSVVATDTSVIDGLMDPGWKDGCVTELAVARDMVEIRMRSVRSGIWFPLGYYRFPTGSAETGGPYYTQPGKKKHMRPVREGQPGGGENGN